MPNMQGLSSRASRVWGLGFVHMPLPQSIDIQICGPSAAGVLHRMRMGGLRVPGAGAWTCKKGAAIARPWPSLPVALPTATTLNPKPSQLRALGVGRRGTVGSEPSRQSTYANPRSRRVRAGSTRFVMAASHRHRLCCRAPPWLACRRCSWSGLAPPTATLNPKAYWLAAHVGQGAGWARGPGWAVGCTYNSTGPGSGGVHGSGQVV